jgi:hypothetical protein
LCLAERIDPETSKIARIYSKIDRSDLVGTISPVGSAGPLEGAFESDEKPASIEVV